MYLSLVDTPSECDLYCYVGSPGEFSSLRYKLNGPLRCYTAYKTCEEVKAAGLPSGEYHLDPDGPRGDNPPFPVYCEVDGHKIMGRMPATSSHEVC